MIDPPSGICHIECHVFSMQSAEVGEWGTTSLLWDYLCLLHSQTLPVFAIGHYYQHVKNYVKNITRRTKTKSAKKSRRFKTWVGFVGQILIQLETSFIRGFRQFPVWCPLGSNSVTTEARTSHLTRHNPMSCHAMSRDDTWPLKCWFHM